MPEESRFYPTDTARSRQPDAVAGSFVDPAAETYEPTAEEIEESERPRRSLWGLVAIITVAAVVIIVLMLLRDCGGVRSAVSQLGGKSIESVEGSKPMEGAVSLWVTEDANLDEVLSSAGVNPTGRLDLGGGRWVVDVAPGTEERAAAALVKQSGVYDAGRVYER